MTFSSMPPGMHCINAPLLIREYKQGHCLYCIHGDRISLCIRIYTCWFPPVEFIRRFMLHILPERFCKVRYYGIFSIRNRNTKLLLCFALIDKLQLPPRFKGLTMIQILELLTGRDYSLCPCCKTGHMQKYKPPE